MGKILKQYRYYGKDIAGSEPRVTHEGLVTGATFLADNDPYLSIISLGIQTVPGVKFRVNEPTGNSMTSNGIVVGNTGIYELNMTEGYEITNLRFDEKSLELIGGSNGNTYLIIDIVYNTED